MSLSSRFLNLSIKEQILITIIALTLFCILAILIICCSLIYEILKKDYEQKKIYFYKRYKEYIESTFYFQNFYLMQYEEIIHRMQKQSWRMQQSVSIYRSSSPLKPFTDYVENVKFIYDELQNNFTYLDSYIKKDSPDFYVITFTELESKKSFVQLFSLFFYQTFSNSIISHDIYDNFRIPGYGVPIIDNPLFYNLNYSTIFCFNHSKISNKIKEIKLEADNEKNSLESIFNTTLDYKINQFLNKTESYMKYITNKLDIFGQIFEKFQNEIKSYSKEIFSNEEIIHEYSNLLSVYNSGIDYENNSITILSSDMENFLNFYIFEMSTIPDILFFLINKLSYSLDIDFIPLNINNNKILSKDLCSIFKIKQIFLSQNNFHFNDKDMHRDNHRDMERDMDRDINEMESDLKNCFINFDLINEQEEIKDIFDIDFENFMENTNLIFQGIFNIIPDNSDFPFFIMKYSYPNYNTLREFQSEYLFSSQVNFYSFAPIKAAQKYVDHIYQVTQNIFFFIVLVIVYSWLICLFVNLMIFFKFVQRWIEPFDKLQEALESNNIKDENIFKYEYDDIINELFLTCKELLTGQIDNNDNGIKSFNILSKEKNKKKLIDKNRYKKNYIINNEIMEELVSNQEKMLDFTKNVKINEPNNINTIITHKKNQNKKKENKANENKINKNINNNKNPEKEKNKENNEAYVNLFKISEFLNYYRSKLESNTIIYENDDNDESKMSKLLSKNTKSINSSILNKNNEANDNDYINMLDETNISYMWYMETKKKYKNFNYNLSSDYKELFTEFNDSYKNNSNSELTKSIHIHKKDKNNGV